MLRSFLLFIFIAPIFAGSAGVKNGSVIGYVKDKAGKLLPGVNVVMVKDGDPPIIRGSISDSNGRYVFYDVPVGKYTLGYQKFGFETITTEAGDPESQSALGQQVRIFVESGSTVNVQNVSLKSLGSFGDAQVRVKLVDSYSGDTIPQANVVLGNNSTNSPSSSGEYFLNVSVAPGDNKGDGFPLQVIAPGYENVSTKFKPIAGQNNEVTLEVPPKLGKIEGRIDFSQFPVNNLHQQTTISVNKVPKELLEQQISPSGHFSITVPVSTEKNRRAFNVTINVKGFAPMVIRNVMAPIAGSTTISQNIRLQAITVLVRGQVVPSIGDVVPGSGVNQAFIRQLGLSAPIQSGFYTFQAVPIGVELTIEAYIKDANGEVERGETTIIATKNGTGSFTVPTIVTQGGGGGDPGL